MSKSKKSKEAVKPKDKKLKTIQKSASKNSQSKKLKNKSKNKTVKESIIKEVKNIQETSLAAKYSEQFKKGIEALLQYDVKSKSKDLFKKDKPIFVQIDCIRMPIVPNRRIRIKLQHTLLTDKNEVCLIVPDLKRGRKVDHKKTIQHYEDILSSKNVKNIQRILPVRQLRVEYDQFELKRQLCGYYDFFLVAGKISGHVFHLLGKTFIEKRKIPVPIQLESGNLNESIETALKKTVLNIHSKGASFIVQFGHTEMTADQLADNLQSVVNSLDKSFPGGWKNIRSLHIKTDKSISIPVYMTLKNPNKVPVPVIKPIRPKEYEKVSGELTTIQKRNEVVVHPGGRVELKFNSLKNKNQRRKFKDGKIKKEKVKTQTRKFEKQIKQKVEIKKEKDNSKYLPKNQTNLANKFSNQSENKNKNSGKNQNKNKKKKNKAHKTNITPIKVQKDL